MRVSRRVGHIYIKRNKGKQKYDIPKQRKLNCRVFLLAGFFISVVAYCTYMMLFPQLELDFINLTIFGGAIFLALLGVSDMMKRGLRLCNTFLLCFFSVLAINNLNISVLQKPKTIRDLYFFFFAPLIFAAILWGGEQVTLRVEKSRGINPDLVASILCCLYCLGQAYLFYKRGIRLFSNQWLSTNSTSFVIPGISGLVALLMWIMLLMLPNVKRPLQIVIVIAPTITSVLSAKRGDAMRILLLVLILYALYQGPELLASKNVLRFTCVIIIGLLLFSYWGNYRQRQRGWTSEHSVGGFLESRTDIDVLNWTFAYTGLNFDVLKQYCVEEEPNGEFEEIFLPVLRLLHGSSAVEEHYKKLETNGLHGFNATTFLGNFVREVGEFYFIGIVLLGIFVVILAQLCRGLHLMGGYGFLLMQTVLSFFGNYYLNVNYIFALFAALILSVFINTEEKTLSDGVEL